MCTRRIGGVCQRYATVVALAVLTGTIACRGEANLPKSGASESEVEKLLGIPAVVDSERREFEGDLRRFGDCLEGRRDSVKKVWRYHKPEGQETLIAFDQGGRVLCAKAGGISIIH